MSQGLTMEAQDWRQEITYLLIMDSWSKGDYSRHIREALMVVDKLPEISHPSGRVPGQVHLVIQILESRRQRNCGENCVTEGLLRVRSAGDKYRPKGAPGE